nr:hypothetical protein [Nocardia cyriacigeorgica]
MALAGVGFTREGIYRVVEGHGGAGDLVATAGSGAVAGVRTIVGAQEVQPWVGGRGRGFGGGGVDPDDQVGHVVAGAGGVGVFVECCRDRAVVAGSLFVRLADDGGEGVGFVGVVPDAVGGDEDVPTAVESELGGV